MAYVKRESFETRIENSDSETKEFFNQLDKKLTSFNKVKARSSLRCVSYRKGRKLIAKIALGGKTLKLFLALDKDSEVLTQGKYHQRDLSETKAYEDVPVMVLIRSDLAARKATQLIDAMMQG